MIQHLRYIELVLRHKYHVFRAGLRLRVPVWRLIIHDWHKFAPVEFFAYSDKFVGKKNNDEALAVAWLHHQNLAPHHWEYWVTRSAHRRSTEDMPDRTIQMPETYVREMIADWIGAQHTYKNAMDARTYYVKYQGTMKIHYRTRTMIDFIFAELE